MKKAVLILMALMLALFGAQASVALNGSIASLISETGETIVPPHVYSAIIRLEDGLFAACSAENGKYALMDENGNILTDFAYSEFAVLSGGILFSKDGKYGVMNRAYETVVPAEYTWLIENGENGYLALRTDVWDDSPDGVYRIDETGYVSPTGVKIASFLAEFKNGLSPALSIDNGRYGYLNADGQWEIRPQYAYADAFADGIAVASLDSGSGVIDASGRWRITPKYDFVSIVRGENALIAAVSYEDGVTVFQADTFEKVYSLDKNTYGAYVSVGGESVIAYLEDRVVLIGKDGREVLSTDETGYIFPVTEDRAIVYQKDGAYLADGEGNVLLSGFEELDFLTEADGKMYFIFSNQTSDYKIGVTDETGKWILPPEYDYVYLPEEGFFAAENDAGVKLLIPSGEIIWEYGY